MANMTGQIDTEGGAYIGSVSTGGGDSVGRDQIVNNIIHIRNQALSVAEEAARTQELATQKLAEGVRDYLQRLRTMAEMETGSPYRGLPAYRLGDASLFFGRNQAIADLRQHLERGRLTILQAASGAGKSSLLQAGLSPRLLADGHLPINLRPYDQPPGRAIKRVFLPHLSQQPFEVSETSKNVYAELASTPLREFLRQVTAVLGPTSTLCLLLDQFEESFTLLSEVDRAAFVAELADCLEDDALNARWVLALRSEFFGDLANFRPRIRNPFENDYRLNPLRPAEAQAAITAPADRQGVGYEPALLDALLLDMAGDGGEVAPPQLQLVCLTLYDLLREHQADNPTLPSVLTLAMYEQSGRAQGILGDHLRRVLARTLTPPERDLARRLLVALVSADQRRLRRTRSDLAKELATYLVAGQSLNDLLERLVVEGRLLNVDEDERTDEPAYELAHDYLLAEIQLSPEEQSRKAVQEMLNQEVEAYKRYKTLLNEDKFNIIHSQREFLVLNETALELLERSQAIIESEAREKEAQRQRELEQIRRLAEEAEARRKAETELAWEREERTRLELERAREQEEQSQRELKKERQTVGRLKRMATWIASVGGIAVILAVAAVLFGLQSQQNAERAELEARKATSRGLAVASIDNFSKDLNLSLLLAMYAISETHTVEAEAALRSALRASRLERTLSGHEGEVYDVTFSPDGTRLATTGKDKLVKIWDVVSGEEVLTLSGHTGIVYNATFYPKDDTVLATASGDGTVRIWDTVTGRETRVFSGHTGEILDVTFSPDGTLMATSGNDKTVRLWDFGSGEQLLTVTGHTTRTRSVEFSPRGVLLATAWDDGSVRIYAVDSGKEFLTLSKHSESVNDIEFSQDGKYLITVSDDSSIIIWSFPDGQMVRTLQDTSRVYSVNFRYPNGKYFITSNWNGEIKLWHIDSDQAMLEISTGIDQSGNWAYRLDFSQYGMRIASASRDGVARIWSLFTPEATALSGHTSNVRDVNFSPDGQRLVTASWDGTAKVWDASTAQELLTLSGHDAVLVHAVFSPDGTRLATASDDETAKVWDAATGRELLTLSPHPNGIHDVNFSPDGARLVTTGLDGTVKIWDANSGEEVHSFHAHNDSVTRAAFSPDGRSLATAGWDQTAKVWDTKTWDLKLTLEGHTDKVDGVTFSPDGSLIATAGFDGVAIIWEASSGEQLLKFDARAQLNDAVFSSDGTLLAIAIEDGTVKVWDIPSREEVLTLPGHLEGVNELAFSPDGKRLATVGGESVGLLYNLDMNELKSVARTRLRRPLTAAECQIYLHQSPCPAIP